MKLLTLIFFFTINELSAQEPAKRQIYVAYGMFSTGNGNSMGGPSKDGAGVFCLGLNTAVGKYFTVGLHGTHEEINEKQDEKKMIEYTTNIIGMDIRMNYSPAHKLLFYSEISPALEYYKERVSYTLPSYGNRSMSFGRRFTFHATLIGLRYQSRLSPFINLGYGYRGILQAGLAYAW